MKGELPNRISLATLQSMARDLGIKPEDLFIECYVADKWMSGLLFTTREEHSSGQEGPAKREDPANSEREHDLGD